MDMKYMQTFNIGNIRIYTKILMLQILQKKGELIMFKFLAKVAEKYAKATNTACMMMWVIHQPKMPASLIKKD